MNATPWLQKVEANKEKLRNLVLGYHPCNRESHKPTDKMTPNITAPNAERSCEIVRERIRQESLDCPEAQFSLALQKGSYDNLYLLLSQTWFGIPEDRSLVSRLEGFGILCDLLDDPPESESE